MIRKKIGKTPGKDIKQGKSTLLRLVGEKKVIELCQDKIDRFKSQYKSRLNKNSLLVDILDFGMNRIY